MRTSINQLVMESLVGIGKHKDLDPSLFPQKQLKMGEKIEHEHTNDNRQAEEIAKDHLAEIRDYYTRLKKMEHTAEEGKPASK